MIIDLGKAKAAQEMNPPIKEIEQSSYSDYGVILKYKNLVEHEELIKQTLQEHITGSVEDCGLTIEEVSDYQTLLDDIERDGIEPHSKAVQDYIFEMFDAVLGIPHRYLGEESILFLDTVCEYEEFPEQINM